MATLTLIEHDGTEHSVTIESGKSLMQVATDNGIPGIDADCGGSCACGTCHVIVDIAWFSTTGTANKEELQMLNMTPELAATSRLACQVSLTEAMDGLVARMPEFQM